MNNNYFALMYLIFESLIILAITLSPKHKMLSNLSMFHSLSNFLLAITVYVIREKKFPIYISKQRYFMLSYFGIYEILITTAVFFFVFLYSAGYVESLIDTKDMQENQIKDFYLVFNLLLLIQVLTFCMNNLMLFWIFLEASTLLIALLTTIPRAEYNIDAALKYTFITSSSMIFTFLGFTFLYAYVKTEFNFTNLNWDQLMDISSQLPPKFMGIIFGLSFIGFGAKAGVVPFHFWRPHLYARAPSVVSAVLSSLIMNSAMYGLFRIYAITRQTQDLGVANKILVIYGLFSIVGAGLSILEEQNLKKIYSFSTIEHVGIIIIGLSTNSKIALFWLLYHILAHSIAKVLLFFSAGILHRQYTKNKATFLRDIMYVQPLASIGLIFGTLIVIGFPPFAVFISKFYVLSQIDNMGLLFCTLLFLAISYIGMIRYTSKIFSQISITFHLEEYMELGSSQSGSEDLSDLQDVLDDDIPIDQTYKLGFGKERFFHPANGMRISIISLISLALIFGVVVPGFLFQLINHVMAELGYS